MPLSTNFLSLDLVKDAEKTLTQKWFEQTLLFRVKGGSISDSLVPPHFVSTSLYQSFRRLFQEHAAKSQGMTYVYYGSRLSGKTTAALAALRIFLKEFDWKMPCLYVKAGGSSISSALRRVLSVPEAVADATYIASLFGQLHSFEKDGLKNELQTCPPVIFLDEIRFLPDKDYELVDNLYRSAYDSRVILFLLTDKEEIANTFCGMNGGKRIVPLTGMHSVTHGHDTWDIRDSFEHDAGRTIAVHIEWHPNNWNRCKLSKMVKLKFPSFDFSQHEKAVDETGKKAYNFIEDGDLPNDAIEKAERIISSANPIDPGFEDPDYDEDDSF